MKTKIIFLFLLSGFLSFSQTLEKLKTETKKIYDANYNMDFDTIVSLSYPKIVETYGGKNAMLDKLDLDYQNEEYRMRLELVNPIFEYADIKKIEGKTFCVINYKNPVRYFFENKLSVEDASLKVAALKASNKSSEVIFEPKRNSINVKRTSKFVAVWDDTTQNRWRFFNFDDSKQNQIFIALFSETTKKELGF